MNKKRKIIFGGVFLSLGMALLVVGFLIQIQLSGISAFAYINNLHNYVFLYIFSYIAIAWGIGLIVTGMLFLILGILEHNFQSKKPFAVAVAVLLVALSISGLFAFIALPPVNHVATTMNFQDHYTEVNATKTDNVSGTIHSTYSGFYYLNISDHNLALGNLPSGGGVTNYSANVTGVLFFNGNYSVVLTLDSHGLKKNFTSWLYVYPQVTVSVSGPKSVNDSSGSTYATYTVKYTGYAPDNYTWSISSFYFGNVQNISYNEYGSTLHAHFYLNSVLNPDPYEYNYTAFIELTVTTKFGDTYAYWSIGSILEGYAVSVVGN